MKFKYRNLIVALTLSGAMALTGCTATNSAARVGNRGFGLGRTAVVDNFNTNTGTSNA